MTIVDELRAAADCLAPEATSPPTLTGEYPNLDACYADLLRNTANTIEAVQRKHPDAIDPQAGWIAPALAAARRINAEADRRQCGDRLTEWVCTLRPGPHLHGCHVDEIEGVWWDQSRVAPYSNRDQLDAEEAQR
jgi:hypothetical protein